MIARTKIQKQVEALSIKHFTKPNPDPKYTWRVEIIDEAHKQWAFKNCLEHKAFATKHKAGCLDCGALFPTSLIKKGKIKCPECKTDLKAVATRQLLDFQSTYISHAVIVEGFQVIRNFYIYANYKKGSKCSFHMVERLQYWASPQGDLVMYGQVPSPFSDGWSGGMECRVNRGSHGYYAGNKWIINPSSWLPGSRFKKEIRAIGLGRKQAPHKFHFIEAVPILLNNPIGETLYKAGETKFLEAMREKPKLIKSLWPSIKICFRRNYHIWNVTTWIDYVQLLKKYGRDIRSPKYICPEDLDKEHNRYVEKERRARRRRQEELRLLDLQKQLEESAKLEESYAKKKGPYIGLEFSNKVYSAHFLNSVADVLEEGYIMRHCVATREYYNEPTLLFSVRKNGERTATVEVSIKTWRVLQVRTFHNVLSPDHKEITEFITENFKLIQDRIKPKKKAVKKTRKLALAS